MTVEPGAPARLEFTPESWHLPQTLTVSAAQDPDDADDAARVSHLVAGSDYAGVTAADVPVAVHDDDKSFGTMTVRLSDGAAVRARTIRRRSRITGSRSTSRSGGRSCGPAITRRRETRSVRTGRSG